MKNDRGANPQPRKPIRRKRGAAPAANVQNGMKGFLWVFNFLPKEEKEGETILT